MWRSLRRAALGLAALAAVFAPAGAQQPKGDEKPQWVRPPIQADLLHDALKKAGVETQLHLVKGPGTPSAGARCRNSPGHSSTST